MTETFIAILIFCIVILLILIMFFALKRIVIRINKQSKDYYLDKLQVFDNLIEEKEKRIKDLDNEIIEKKNKIENNDFDDLNSKEVVYISNEKNIDYDDEDLLSKMQEIDKKFNLNLNEILKEFIHDHYKEEDIKKYDTIVHIRDKFDSDKVFELMSKEEKDAIKDIKQLLGKNAFLFDNFNKGKENMDLLGFLTYLDTIISKNDPYIHVYISNNSKINNDNDFVKIEVDNSIYRGMNIIYKGKLYDYSLR